MKKIISILLVSFLLVSVCGCQNENITSQTGTGSTNQSYSEGEYTGLWTHTEYPDPYSIVVFNQQGDKISLEMTAVRGNGAQIATSQVADVQLVNGQGTFRFVDSFGNSGRCEISISNDVLSLKYDTDQPYQGNWCVDAGEGSYTKSKELSEINWKNENDTSFNNGGETISLEQFGVTDKWMYRVIEYTNSGEDIYDDDIDFNISESEGTKQKRENGIAVEKTYFMTENSYDDLSSEKDGYIKAYPSDRAGYDAKILLERHDGSKETLYFRVVVPNCVFEFIYENGEEFGIYETMDYAHRNYNTDGGGYRRDEYEYKEYYNKSATWTPHDE